MPAKKSHVPEPRPSAPQRALEVLAWLESQGSESERQGMVRYGIPSETAFGVSVGALQKHAERQGRDHELAGALWETGRYEARMLACLALHDKTAGDEPFLARLPLVEEAATDGRNFVKKGVLWALRAIGERNVELRGAAAALAARLAESPDTTARWVGKGARKKLS